MEFFRGRAISAVRIGRLWVYAIHAEGERFRVLFKRHVVEEVPFRPSVGLPAGWSEVSAPEL
jgi:hypothetical protein